MKKKLFKAKKNWVIGVIAGLMLFAGGATTVSADDVQDSNTVINYTSNSNDNTPDYNVNVVKNNKTNKNAFNYTKKETPTLDVVTWGGDNYNGISQSKIKNQNISNFNKLPEVKTDMNKVIDNDSLQYHFDYTGNNKNYKSISSVSKAAAKDGDGLARNDFTYHYTDDAWDGDVEKTNKDQNTHTYSLTYTDNNKVINFIPAANDGVFDQNEFGRVRADSITNGFANFNAPKVTFDKNGITSYLQTFYGGHGATHYSVDFTSNIQGMTFKDGKQLPLTFFLQNIDDTAKYMRGIGYNYKELNWEQDRETGLPYTGGNYVNGSTSYFLTNDGIYVFFPNGSGVSNWNWPAAVRLPLSLIKEKYVDLFDNFSQKQEDLSTVKEDVTTAINEQIKNGLIDKGTGKIIKNKVMADATKVLEKQTLNIFKNGIFNAIKGTFTEDNALKMISSNFTDITKGTLDLEKDANLIKNVGEKDIDIIKNSIDTVSNTANQGYDVYQMAKLYRSTHNMKKNSKTLDTRYNNLKKTRKYHLDDYKNEAKNVKTVASTLLLKNKANQKGWRKNIVVATVAVLSAAIITTFALIKWNVFNLGKLASKFGIKVIDKWIK